MNIKLSESVFNVDYVNWIKRNNGYYAYGRTQSTLFFLSDDFETIETIKECLDDTNYKYNKYSIIVPVESNIVFLPDQSGDLGFYDLNNKSFSTKKINADYFYTVGFVDVNERIICFPFYCKNPILSINKRNLECVEDESYHNVLFEMGWGEKDGICVSPFLYDNCIFFAKYNSRLLTRVSTDYKTYKNIYFDIDDLSIEKINKIDDGTLVILDNSRMRIIMSDFEGNNIRIISEFNSEYEKNYIVYSFGDEDCIVFLPKRGKRIYIYNRKEEKMITLESLPREFESYNLPDNYYFRGVIEGTFIYIFPTLTNGLLSIDKETLKCCYYRNCANSIEKVDVIRQRVLYRYSREVMYEENASLDTFIDLIKGV